MQCAVGDSVIAGQDFVVVTGGFGRKLIEADRKGKITEIKEDGSACIKFLKKEHSDDVQINDRDNTLDEDGEEIWEDEDGWEGGVWVMKEQMHNLHPLPRDMDTVLQKLVKMARLLRVEVLVVVLYTGPMFQVLHPCDGARETESR